MNNEHVFDLLNREQREFQDRHPASRELFERGAQHYLYGTPSHWMRRWAGGFPMYVDDARGSHVWCVDGFEYVDFCLGDTGGMCGHAEPAITEAVARQLGRGATFMLPTADANWVAEELARRFRLPYWGFTTSATDANRAVIRLSRMLTGRDRVLVFNGCYHGSVEEAHVTLSQGAVGLRNGIHANAFDHARLSRVIEFNDVPALESALADGDVACVLAEPCMTNFGMIEPEPGFLQSLRALTRRMGTLLVMDETHTISAGPGGYTARENLEPDFIVIGKAIGGGIPVGLFGASETVAQRLWKQVPKVNPVKVRQSSHLGFGGTLAGSALQVAAVRVVLSQVLTEINFGPMIENAKCLARALRSEIAAHGFPWHVVQSGARVEVMWSATRPRNASDVVNARDSNLDALLHVYGLNRGVIVTPFHNMFLMCPATSASDIEKCASVFRSFCGEMSQVTFTATL
jgi:glutamate-1-semialdehyde 2,1-aminomutase